MLGLFWHMDWIAENQQKLVENIVRFGILGCLKRWLKHFFGTVGSKMAFFVHLASTCGTCWRQDGQQDEQDGQHERQDSVKIATEHFPMCF